MSHNALGPQFWEHFNLDIEDHHAPHLTPGAAQSRERWVQEGDLWPTEYLDHMEGDQEAREALHSSLRHFGASDTVDIVRRGPVRPGINNASLHPDWAKTDEELAAEFPEYGKQVHHRTIPLEKIIGIGHPPEGEVFWRND